MGTPGVAWYELPGRGEIAMDERVLRTPEERFEGLPGFAFHSRTLEVPDPDGGRLRIHAVDEGPTGAAPVLLLHGEPTWSYLYRKVIPVLTAGGHRVLAPDLVGFGRSDKPASPRAYTFERHVAWMLAWLRELDLQDVTLVCQDWGGPIGLAVLAEEERRFARVVAANTILPTVDPELTQGILEWRSEALLDWIVASQRMPVFPVGAIVAAACARPVPAEVRAAYDAPFPDARYQAGARQFPMLIPITRGDPGAARNRATWAVLQRFEKPFLTAFSDGDPATRGWDEIFRRWVPGAAGREPVRIEKAGHFLQEDAGEALGRAIARFLDGD
jgi:haloalkane dehalogenase